MKLYKDNMTTPSQFCILYIFPVLTKYYLVKDIFSLLWLNKTHNKSIFKANLCIKLLVLQFLSVFCGVIMFQQKRKVSSKGQK